MTSELLAATPDSVQSYMPPISVTYTTNYLAPGQNYFCDFGNGNVQPGVVSANNVTCQAASTVSGARTPQVMVNTNSTLYTVIPTAATFEFFNCYEITACRTCGNHPVCQYCTTGSPYTCTYTNGSCVGGVTPVASCVGMISLALCFPTRRSDLTNACRMIFKGIAAGYPSPSSLHVSQGGITVNLTLQGSGLPSGNTTCLWTSPGGAAIITLISGSSPNFACPAPTNISFPGVWSVEVAVDGNPATAPKTISVYSCPIAQMCSECVSPNTPLCHWCPYTENCDVDNLNPCGTTTISSFSSCPGPISTVAGVSNFPLTYPMLLSCLVIVSQSLTQDTLVGQSNLTLVLSLAPPNGVECSFGSYGPNFSSPLLV